MRMVTVDREGVRRWGVVADGSVHLAPQEFAPELRTFIERGQTLPSIRRWEAIGLERARLLAPIPEPRRNIVCLGLNYADHAAEVQGVAIDEVEAPACPMFFTKATTTVTGPAADIVLDERVTRRLDWEVELAVVVGRGGRFIPATAAMEHVFGYAVINDLSARELQRNHGQYFLGKSMDGSAPMGPWIVTADEIEDPHALAIGCTVNGVSKQASSTANLMCRIPRIIEILSRVMTLVAGDIIATGTPGGVGFARDPREFLAVGDVVECHVEGIGSISNRLVAPAADG